MKNLISNISKIIIEYVAIYILSIASLYLYFEKVEARETFQIIVLSGTFTLLINRAFKRNRDFGLRTTLIIALSYLLSFCIIVITNSIGNNRGLKLILISITHIAIKTIYKEVYDIIKNRNKAKAILISDKVTLEKIMFLNSESNYRISAIYSSNEELIGTRINSITVQNLKKLKITRKNKDYQIIIENQTIQKLISYDIFEKIDPSKVYFYEVEKMFRKYKSNKLIEKLDLSSLLRRKEIETDKKSLHNFYNNKVILVTGGAGSIGSQLVRELQEFNPKKVLILDIKESELYMLQNDLNKNRKNDTVNKVFVGSVLDYSYLEQIVKLESVDIAFHAAAYKHVPLMENEPRNAVITNILGTINLINVLSHNKNTELIMISTDKAVNPTNVMGATKRAAEKAVLTLSKNKGVNSVITRFGNVLGSNGSVIPIFKKQIEEGGPVTITHSEIKRYMMTIPEACKLVLEAGRIGEDNTTFVFDMGEQIKILDIAKMLISEYNSNSNSPKNIEIIETGLRPGEKMFEELFYDSAEFNETSHPSLLSFKENFLDEQEIESKIKNLIEISLDYSKSEFEIVKQLKTVVPEFKSENSRFSKLDDN